eukprot:gene40047-48792_t
MVLDFREAGEVRVTMAKSVEDILRKDACRHFHSHAAKRVRPECLTAVSLLTSWASVRRRRPGKAQATRGLSKGGKERGIELHDCMIVLGSGGTLYAKSGDRDQVHGHELVGLSDTACHAIHLRNFMPDQRYGTGPEVIYYDNLMSCMALMKRGRPGLLLPDTTGSFFPLPPTTGSVFPLPPPRLIP